MKLALAASILAFFAAVSSIDATVVSAALSGGKHDGHHHHRHHRHGKGRHRKHDASMGGVAAPLAAMTHVDTTLNATAGASVVQAVAADTRVESNVTAGQIKDKMQALENQLQPTSVDTCSGAVSQGRLMVNGPLAPDFSERFQQAVAYATGCDPTTVSVVSTTPQDNNVLVVDFTAFANTVHSVEDQAADPASKLANGPFRPYLVADDAEASGPPAQPEAASALAQPETAPVVAPAGVAPAPQSTFGAPAGVAPAGVAPAGVAPAGVAPPPQTAPTDMDIDTEMPYGELEPFGREDTAQELSEQAIKESDTMVDQLERAEVAEEKRSVFRALTRLRGAAITSFDGIARSQTGNIDEYNKVHQWRRTHPLNHLADEESDVGKWAFPDNAD